MRGVKTNNPMWYYVYVRFGGDSRFRAYLLEEDCSVSNIRFATQYQNDEYSRMTLQDIADANRADGMVIQLRDTKGNVVFETE